MKGLALMALVWFNYCLLAVNYRAVAHARYGATMGTDAVIAFCGFTIFKLIGDAQWGWDLVGYIVGGAVGGASGIWLTRHWRSE